ncbi:MAG: hypothetical protein Q8L24_02870 [bacterium]|nr:hypothetical protein [bacterium]
MTPLQWIWVLSSAVNITVITCVFVRLYDEQPNGLPEQITAAILVALGPIGTLLLCVTFILGYGLMMAVGALQGLGCCDKNKEDE